jgi:DNA-binding protein H-NS
MEVGIARTKKAEHTYVSISFGGHTVANVNLSRMDVQALMDLRDQVDQRLREHRVDLQRQLERIALVGGERVRPGRPEGSALKGRKVPPKYRSPSGETWAGRGARPRWLVVAVN